MAGPEEYLYLWAIVPPPAVAREIDALRIEFSENFQCFKALKPPVHLTLFTIFKDSISRVQAQCGHWKEWLATQPPFGLVLRNFDFFDNLHSPVVFINVMDNSKLTILNAGLSRETQKRLELTETPVPHFHPHFTIGYRDTPVATFPLVKKVYGKRRYSASFEVSHVCLFRHNRIKWELQHEFLLGESRISQGKLW